MVPLQDLRVNANPTKEFFISVLVRDLLHIDSIIDLVDNSVDGALRLRGSGKSYDGLSVRIEVDQEHFRIADNCGGMTIDMAQNYAFRFGRPPGMTPTMYSVGQFGVGMKRALFKLGREFTVESRTKNEGFTIEVDVDKWEKDPLWEFRFADVQEGLVVPEEDRGVTLTVRRLNDDAREAFGQPNFLSHLASEIQLKHQQSISNGLKVTINQVPVDVKLSGLLQSEELKPIYKALDLEPNVHVRIYAGLGESSPRDAGWYVYCNGRLVVGPEQTIKTGWGEGDGKVVPRYHNQFARFRGYVFFDSDKASDLPWNTSKTDVDTDSKVYKTARSEMVSAMRTVLNFLNELDKETSDAETVGRPLEAVVKNASEVRLAEVKPSNDFVIPVRKLAVSKLEVGRITYSKPISDINRVKKALGVTSNKEVGEKTFDYYLRMECEER